MAAAIGEESGAGCAIDDRQVARLTSHSSCSGSSGSGSSGRGSSGSGSSGSGSSGSGSSGSGSSGSGSSGSGSGRARQLMAVAIGEGAGCVIDRMHN